jgi:hypothetical protein
MSSYRLRGAVPPLLSEYDIIIWCSVTFRDNFSCGFLFRDAVSRPRSTARLNYIVNMRKQLYWKDKKGHNLTGCLEITYRQWGKEFELARLLTDLKPVPKEYEERFWKLEGKTRWAIYFITQDKKPRHLTGRHCQYNISLQENRWAKNTARKTKQLKMRIKGIVRQWHTKVFGAHKWLHNWDPP